MSAVQCSHLSEKTSRIDLLRGVVMGLKCSCQDSDAPIFLRTCPSLSSVCTRVLPSTGEFSTRSRQEFCIFSPFLPSCFRPRLCFLSLSSLVAQHNKTDQKNSDPIFAVVLFTFSSLSLSRLTHIFLISPTLPTSETSSRSDQSRGQPQPVTHHPPSLPTVHIPAHDIH